MCFKRAAHFFDGEHNSGQWCVECGSDAGRATGEDQSFFHIVLWKARKSPQPVHDGCADLYGGAFASHRCTDEKPHDREHDLADGHARGKHLFAHLYAFFWIERCDGFWDAAALRSRKKSPAGINDQRESDRCKQQGEIG